MAPSSQFLILPSNEENVGKDMESICPFMCANPHEALDLLVRGRELQSYGQSRIRYRPRVKRVLQGRRIRPRPKARRPSVGEVHGRKFNSLFTTSTTHYIPLFGLMGEAILTVMHPGLTLFAWSFSSKMNVCCETEGFETFIRAARSRCECVLRMTSHIETPITTALKLFELPHSRSTTTYSKRPPRSCQCLGTRRPTGKTPPSL